MISTFQNKKNCFIFNNTKFYRSVFEYINSNMYVVINNENALVIDPHEDKEILKKLEKVKNITILLTHEHTDHISGIFSLQKQFNTRLICTKLCADYISQEKNVRPVLMTLFLEEQDRVNGTNLLEKFKKEFVPHIYSVDIAFEKKYKMIWGNHNLEFFNILGHSEGSCVIILDENIVFTGDSLMKDLPVITRFPGGNKKKYVYETLPFLESRLNPEMIIMPGHGNPFMLKEIMKDGKINVEFK